MKRLGPKQIRAARVAGLVGIGPRRHGSSGRPQAAAAFPVRHLVLARETVWHCGLGLLDIYIYRERPVPLDQGPANAPHRQLHLPADAGPPGVGVCFYDLDGNFQGILGPPRDDQLGTAVITVATPDHASALPAAIRRFGTTLEPARAPAEPATPPLPWSSR
jgi:hypothetical protein